MIARRAKLLQDDWGEDKGCMLTVQSLAITETQALVDVIASERGLQLEIAC